MPWLGVERPFGALAARPHRPCYGVRVRACVRACVRAPREESEGRPRKEQGREEEGPGAGGRVLVQEEAKPTRPGCRPGEACRGMEGWIALRRQPISMHLHRSG